MTLQWWDRLTSSLKSEAFGSQEEAAKRAAEPELRRWASWIELVDDEGGVIQSWDLAGSPGAPPDWWTSNVGTG